MPDIAHAPAPGAGGPKTRNLEANQPIAPRIPVFFSPFWRERRQASALADPTRPQEQTLVSAWNVLGCHRVSSVKKGAKPPLALHHLVTASSVKKRLMESSAFVETGPAGPPLASDASRTHFSQIRDGRF
jgi:hypothetical protein